MISASSSKKRAGSALSLREEVSDENPIVPIHAFHLFDLYLDKFSILE